MTAVTTRATALLLKLLNAVAHLNPARKPMVPVGYQDETGFHFGEKPAEKKIAWPPAD
jgi:hypothetical protein